MHSKEVIYLQCKKTRFIFCFNRQELSIPPEKEIEPPGFLRKQDRICAFCARDASLSSFRFVQKKVPDERDSPTGPFTNLVH